MICQGSFSHVTLLVQYTVLSYLSIDKRLGVYFEGDAGIVVTKLPVHVFSSSFFFSFVESTVWGIPEGRGGGGHCPFEVRYLLPNFHPCFSVPSALHFFFTAPYYLGS